MDTKGEGTERYCRQRIKDSGSEKKNRHRLAVGGNMKAEYRRDMYHNYLILEDEKEADRASYQVRMLLGNVIPSILKCHIENLDGKNFYSYEITSRQSVASYYEGKKFRSADVRMILEGIIRVMEDFAEYLMNPEQLLIRPDYIYLDIESGTAFFCCLPGQGGEVQSQLRELVEYMLPKLDHEDQEAVVLGYGIYRKVMEPGFQLETMKEAAYQSCPEISAGDRKNPEKSSMEGADTKEEKEAEIFPAEENTGNPCIVSHEQPEREGSGWWWIAGCTAGAAAMLALSGAGILGLLPRLPAEIVMGGGIAAFGIGGIGGWISEKKKKRQEKKAEWRSKTGKEKESFSRKEEKEEFLEEEHSGGRKEEKISPENQKPFFQEVEMPSPELQKTVYGETEALFSGTRSGPSTLVSREPGEHATIYLEQEITVVGKLVNAADAVIPIPTVSRVHARIRRAEGEYYLADLNSRNGTAVNGRLLKNGEEYCLQDEDEVDFAQARYIFLK